MAASLRSDGLSYLFPSLYYARYGVQGYDVYGLVRNLNGNELVEGVSAQRSSSLEKRDYGRGTS